MPRALRILLTLLSATLLLFTLTACLASFRRTYLYPTPVNNSPWQFESSRGRLVLARFRIVLSTTGYGRESIERVLYGYRRMPPSVLLAPPAWRNAFGFTRGNWYGHESNNDVIINGLD